MTSRHLPSVFATGVDKNPFFQSLQREIDRVFDRFRDPDAPPGEDLFTHDKRPVMPALDVAEADGQIEITAELPGVREEDLDISITDGVLTLKGEKSADREEKDKDYHLVERSHGRFRRSVPLGFSPEPDKVVARFADGILKLRIEKPEAAVAKTQKIKITKG